MAKVGYTVSYYSRVAQLLLDVSSIKKRIKQTKQQMGVDLFDNQTIRVGAAPALGDKGEQILVCGEGVILYLNVVEPPPLPV